MVDVTFPLIILLGGLIAGLVTARVHGPAAASLWMSVVPHLVARTPEEPFMSPGWAFFLADVLWFSPVIGGFIGVAAVALGGPVVILIGWVLVRLFRTPEAQPAAPSPS
jgi:hypothetical protein